MSAQLGMRLQIAAVVFILFGLVMAAAAAPALSAPVAMMGDAIFWPIDGSPGGPSTAEERLLTAIVGGVMVGWGMMILLLGRGASIAKATLIGGLAWYAVDSLGSIVAGGWLNAVSNAAFLALIVWAVLPGLGAGRTRAAA